MQRNGPLLSPRTLLFLIVGVAVLVAAILVVLSELGGVDSASEGDVSELHSGIPQDETTLGKSGAPVTVCLYEDFQCPYCGQFNRDTFPRLVNNYVRNGKAKMVSVPLAFLGSDSITAAQAALAASNQNRYWPYYSLLFATQKQENSGYVTSDYLEGLAQKTPGLKVKQWSSDLDKNSYNSDLKAAQSRAQDAGIDSTPTLVIDGPKGEKTLVGLHDYDQISKTIDQVNGS